MTYHLDRLIHPEDYNELDIQMAIEHYWPCLFRLYRLCPEQKTIVMPGAWMPDIIAVETTSDHGSLLIVELKGVPPCGGLESSIDQVVDYGRWYHQEHPGERIRLAVVGPWGTARLEPVIERGTYSVVVLSLYWIGERLSAMADDLLLWSTHSPASCFSPVIDLEASILRLPALTALIEA